MFKKMLVATATCVALAGALWTADDYYSVDTLDWYEKNDNSIGRRQGAAYMPFDNAMYLFCWRLLDNYCPKVSEMLAPSPIMGKMVSVERATETENYYYYNAWSGRVIRIKGEKE